MNEITNNMFQAIDILVDKKIEGLKFNRTEQACISSVVNEETGEYIVDTGEVQYTAYSSNGRKFRKGDYVLVNIPNNSYSETKTIIDYAYDVDGNEKVNYAFQRPLSKMIDITGNLVNQYPDDNAIKEGEMVANYVFDNDIDISKILLRTINLSENPYFGYTRLGVSANFRTLLDNFNVVSGIYGLKFIITSIYENKQLISEYNFTNADFFGNAYDFTGYQEQSSLIDISELGNIKNIDIYFFQGSQENQGTFVDIDNNKIPFKDNLNNLLQSNLFVKDLYISLGYSTEETENNDFIVLTTNQPLNFNKNDTQRKIILRWISIDDSGNAIVHNESDSAMVKWYRYNSTSNPADIYCGQGWENINKIEDFPYPYSFTWNEESKSYIYYVNDEPKEIKTFSINYEYEYNLNKNLKEEKIKVIIFKEGQILKSNILTFSNNKEAIDQATLSAAIGLTYKFKDGSNGRYYFYGPDGYILDQSNVLIEREVEILFNGSALTEASSIKWNVENLNNFRMIKNLKYTNWESESQKDEQLDESLELNKIKFQVGSFLNQGQAANTFLECSIVYNEITYNLIIPFYFGRDSGVEYSLGLGLYYIQKENGEIKNLIPRQSVAISGDYAFNTQKYCIRPILYNSLGEEVYINEITNNTAELEIINGEDYEDINKQILKKLSSGTITFEYNNKTYYYLFYRQYPNGYFDSVPKINTSYITVKCSLGIKSVEKKFGIPISYASETYLNGPSNILYDSAGQPPRSKIGYSLIDYDSDGKLNTYNTNFQLTNIKEDNPEYKYLPRLYSSINDEMQLVLPQLFVKDLKTIPCLAFIDENDEVKWSQPILTDIESYASTTLNEWDGSFSVGEVDNILMSKVIGAGHKDSNNKFSGVFMGDVSEGSDASLSKTGLYGFCRGEQVYAFKDDGTAFIGGTGTGRIEFDGKSGIIQSGNYQEENGKAINGMKIDLDDGTIKASNLNIQDKLVVTPQGKIYIDSSAVITGEKFNRITSLENLSKLSQRILVQEDGVHIKGAEEEDDEERTNSEAIYTSDSIQFKNGNNELSKWTQNEMSLKNLSRFTLGDYLAIQIERDDNGKAISVSIMENS